MGFISERMRIGGEKTENALNKKFFYRIFLQDVLPLYVAKTANPAKRAVFTACDGE